MLSVVPYFLSEYCKLHTNYKPEPICTVMWGGAHVEARGGPLLHSDVYENFQSITDLKVTETQYRPIP